MLILAAGGRGYTDTATIRHVLEEYVPLRPTVLHGGANGADRLAGAVAHELGMPVQVVRADWSRFGRAAGPIRNRTMLEMGPDLVIAFPGGRGTYDMVRRARAAGVLVREVALEEQV